MYSFRSGAWLCLAAALAGCAHAGTEVNREEGVNFGAFRHVGVRVFRDPRGQGGRIAERINAGLTQQFYEPVDTKDLEQVLARYKPSKDYGLGLEALETVRSQTSADAIVAGRLNPDWSACMMSMVETATGEEVLHAFLRPPRGKKSFATADEVADEALKVITGKK